MSGTSAACAASDSTIGPMAEAETVGSNGARFRLDAEDGAVGVLQLSTGHIVDQIPIVRLVGRTQQVRADAGGACGDPYAQIDALDIPLKVGFTRAAYKYTVFGPPTVEKAARTVDDRGGPLR